MDAKANAALEEFRAEVCHAPCVPEIPLEDNTPKKLKAANIPKRYQGATFENLRLKDCPPQVQDMAKKARSYACALHQNVKNGTGLLFFGEVGRMKTTLACCVAREAIKQGRSVYFISMPELLDTMLTMSRNRDNSELKRFEKKIKDTALLILDDFGAEYPQDWVLNKVDAIITHRYNEMLPVIITTNLLPTEIRARYVTRVFDRLRSTSILLGTYGDSLRQEVK